jgi:hypothetical protein
MEVTICISLHIKELEHSSIKDLIRRNVGIMTEGLQTPDVLDKLNDGQIVEAQDFNTRIIIEASSN